MLTSRVHRLAAPIMGAALVLLLLAPQPGAVTAQSRPDFAPGEILVKFRAGTSEAAKAVIHAAAGGTKVREIQKLGVHVVRVPQGQELARIESYKRNGAVEFAEVNGVWSVFLTPNDPLVGSQWQYNNTSGGRAADADIDAFEAWDVTTGSAAVIIAILDTGIDQSHLDLASKLDANIDFTDSPTVDDFYGHGTHVAGSAAAVTNNGQIVAGTCWNCRLFNVKVLNDSGSGLWEWVANGITWAADNGADVISMSLGGTSASSLVEAAINYAWGKNVVITAAAGNSNSSAPHYPAFYTNVIAVASTNNQDRKSSFSNWGTWVEVAAPGENILSTAPDHSSVIWPVPPANGAGTISGTSMATPHVAGVLGLIWSTGMCTTNACVRTKLESEADKIRGTGRLWTKGRINAFNSVTP